MDSNKINKNKWNEIEKIIEESKIKGEKEFYEKLKQLEKEINEVKLGQKEKEEIIKKLEERINIISELEKRHIEVNNGLKLIKNELKRINEEYQSSLNNFNEKKKKVENEKAKISEGIKIVRKSLDVSNITNEEKTEALDKLKNLAQWISEKENTLIESKKMLTIRKDNLMSLEKDHEAWLKVSKELDEKIEKEKIDVLQEITEKLNVSNNVAVQMKTKQKQVIPQKKKKVKKNIIKKNQIYKTNKKSKKISTNKRWRF